MEYFRFPRYFVANGTVQQTYGTSGDPGGPYYNLTVYDNKVEYDFINNFTWHPSPVSLNQNGLYITNGNLLTFSGAPPITAVHLDATVSGFGIGNVTFNSTNIAVDWQNVTFHTGDKVIISAVPEPDEYLMMLLGAGLVAFQVKRKQKAI